MAIIPKNHRFDGNVYLKTKKKKIFDRKHYSEQKMVQRFY